MKKTKCVKFLFVALIMICQVAFAEETENYCNDSGSWKEWDELVHKHPLDPDVQILHALRVGFCMKIEQGSISFEMANDLFNRAHEMVIQKKFYKQKEEKEKEL